MGVNLRGRSFLKLYDFTTEEIKYLLELSKEFKRLKMSGTPHKYLEGKNIVLVFEKTSTRTRCAFEVAGMDLGMGVTYLDPGSSQMGKKESIEDTANVLGRMYDGIEYRGFEQEKVEKLAQCSGVPVWNGLTDAYHPTQALADLMTIEEYFGFYKGLNVCFVGYADACVGISTMVLCAKMGINCTIVAPRNHFPDEMEVQKCRKIARENDCTIKITDDMKSGCENQDVIYTDVWVAMAEPQEVWEERIKDLKPYKVTKDIMDNANTGAIFMHCLPSFHDTNTTIGNNVYEKFGLKEMEVSDEVFRSKASRVFDEAENRMHTIKAIMYATLK